MLKMLVLVVFFMTTCAALNEGTSGSVLAKVSASATPRTIAGCRFIYNTTGRLCYSLEADAELCELMYDVLGNPDVLYEVRELRKRDFEETDWVPVLNATCGSAVDIDITQLSGLTCDASSEYSSDWLCSNVWDGLFDGVGSSWAVNHGQIVPWITIYFPQKTTIVAIKWWPRCNVCDQFSRFTLESSDSPSEELTRTCSTCVPEEYPVDLGPNDYIKLTAYDPCAHICSMGFREIQLMGHV